ncbi:hypothetical protein PSI22_20190 [Xenorhabdus sp. XENO-7]|uniref:Uncharacterized protein n=1 Tax=Xenorhabdus aichiensis TaxID=3025874 RepID=A0ABT5MA82_9GAMM|nr:hypothetical protein [Xenorhabdus aichiensis]MDC9623890.1 hypothetical protein [Xenorhabdus aichiensis]
MASLTKSNGIAQIRCRFTPGGRATPFCYEIRILGKWELTNHSFVQWVVGEYRERSHGQ